MASPPRPARIGPNPTWVSITAAVFGGVTLLGFFVIAYWTGSNPDFVCAAFLPISVIFSLGAALSAGFIGGAAAVNGTFGSKGQDNAVAFSAGGGIAVLFIALYAMNAQFKEDVCRGLATKVSILEQKVTIQERDLSVRQTSIDELKKEALRVAQEIESRVKTFHAQPIKIAASTEQASTTPLKQLSVTYIGKQGPELAKRTAEGTNVFKIDLADMNDDDRRIGLEVDPLLASESGPVSIVIDKISHQIDPLRIDLVLHFTRTNLAAGEAR
ncbi:hypothetical protein RAD15_28925 [Bradyrhizobium sp. 14AA]